MKAYETISDRERERPITSQDELGITTPVFGLTQYFFGFVVFTWIFLPATKNKEGKNNQIHLHHEFLTCLCLN